MLPESDKRFRAAIERIDAANADDPHRVSRDGREIAAEVLYAGSRVEPDQSPQGFVFIWLGVLLLFFVFVVLGVADIRLTARLRRKP